MTDELDTTAAAYESQARAAILAELDEDADVARFVRSHLDELDADYWVEHFGTPAPTAEAVVAGLEMGWARTDEEDEEIWHSVDFALPDDASEQIVVVNFDRDGAAGDVTVEN